MISIRSGVFETNSSSVHAVVVNCIVKEEEHPTLSDLGVLEVRCNEDFGWAFECYSDTYSKLEYLWLLAEEYGVTDKWLKKIDKAIQRAGGVGAQFSINGGHIDHTEDKQKLLDYLEDDERLYGFLFNPESMIITANDNEEYEYHLEGFGVSSYDPRSNQLIFYN